MKAAVVAILLMMGAAQAQECATPTADATEILMAHKAPTEFLLSGDKAKAYMLGLGATEDMVEHLTHIQLWLLPDGMRFLGALYVNGCRAYSFTIPVSAAPIKTRGA